MSDRIFVSIRNTRKTLLFFLPLVIIIMWIYSKWNFRFQNANKSIRSNKKIWLKAERRPWSISSENSPEKNQTFHEISITFNCVFYQTDRIFKWKTFINIFFFHAINMWNYHKKSMTQKLNNIYIHSI